jgi:peptidoglycan hydrolase-like protein with peptidoglycan-binding domain
LDTEAVKDLQTKLNKLGYNLVVDGLFGGGTTNAIIDFQTNNSLDPDGVVGQVTLTAIKNMVIKVSGPVKKTYIEIIQEVSVGSADEWIKGITAAVEAAKANGNLGALEIFAHLPTLIENIHAKYSAKPKIW